MNFDWSSGKLAEGLHSYQVGEFFAAHEEWESVWLQATGEYKVFLQALIQVAAAFHHLGRENPTGARQLLQAASQKLAPFPDCFGGISIALLREDITNCLQALAARNLPSELVPPKIRPLGVDRISPPDT